MEQLKLEKEEITLLNNLKNNRELLIKEFGKISIIEVQTEKRKKAAMTEYENLEKTQAQFAKTLETKYGRGTVDIESGIFIPLK
jgi:hypothetical protein